jgi:four helix bundle protein
MGGIRSFEDLVAWRKARTLAQEAYVVTSRGAWAADFALRDQFRRAASSAMSNIAEGFGRRTDREFRQFLVQARGSIAEVKSILYLARDVGYVEADAFQRLFDLADEIGKMTYALGRYLTKRSESTE